MQEFAEPRGYIHELNVPQIALVCHRVLKMLLSLINKSEFADIYLISLIAIVNLYLTAYYSIFFNYCQ